MSLCAACSELTDEDVRTAIKNSGGVKGSLLIPDAPFELLVRRALTRLLPLALQCKDFVHAELLRIAGQCSPPDVDRFPTLQVWSCVISAAADAQMPGRGPQSCPCRPSEKCTPGQCCWQLSCACDDCHTHPSSHPVCGLQWLDSAQPQQDFAHQQAI